MTGMTALGSSCAICGATREDKAALWKWFRKQT